MAGVLASLTGPRWLVVRGQWGADLPPGALHYAKDVRAFADRGALISWRVHPVSDPAALQASGVERVPFLAFQPGDDLVFTVWASAVTAQAIVAGLSAKAPQVQTWIRPGDSFQRHTEAALWGARQPAEVH